MVSDGLVPAWFARLSPAGQSAFLELQELVTAQLELERSIRVVIARARKAGVSWWALGVGLGVTGEAARRRYGGSR